MYLARRFSTLVRQQSLLKTLPSSRITPSIAHSTSLKSKAAAAEPSEVSQVDNQHCKDVFSKVFGQLAAREEGRLFGVVHLCGKQFKVTAGDIILVEGYWPPTIGDEIRLEKVLLAAGRDFTLIGCPMLAPGLVDIKATIIEKTLTHTKTHFKMKRRKQYMRINFQRSPSTMIRINSIEIHGRPDEPPAEPVDDEKRVF